MGEIAPRGKRKDSDLEKLLLMAKQYEREQQWLIESHLTFANNEYNKAILIGIKRIVDLIERQTNKA